MRRHILSQYRQNERGQTILLVALAIVSLLGMAALAIDVVTLYLARSEIQRAADAAALAGAKAIADSGVTTVPTTAANYLTVQALAQGMSNAALDALLVNTTPPPNPVIGGRPNAFPAHPLIDWTRPGNPQLTVSLRRNNLPTFFSKIFGRASADVSAAATAEVYNPANQANITPMALTGVKPWLVANVDPTGTAPRFVDSATWAVDSGVIGKAFDLVSDCAGLLPGTCGPTHVPGSPKPLQVEYLPALITTPAPQNVCPPCAGATDFERSIECADVATQYKVLSCGGGGTNAQWDNTVNPGAPPGNDATALGGECLIHASNVGPLQGQDLLQDPGPWPTAPFQIKAQSGLQTGNFVTTSNSIVTIPLIDPAGVPLTGGPVTIVGYLQAFINQVDPGPSGLGIPPHGSINVTVLNIAGCSSANNAAPPVVGSGGASPVPVRLITPP